jgi:hypothetical protein
MDLLALAIGKIGVPERRRGGKIGGQLGCTPMLKADVLDPWLRPDPSRTV